MNNVPSKSSSGAQPLVDSVGFEILGPGLAQDVEAALEEALSGGAVFAQKGDALFLFRQMFAGAVRDIETHPRGRLFQEFLRKGPYEDSGEIPEHLRSERLSDAESAAAITFIHAHMVNCFKGAVAEILAAKACLRLLKRICREGALPQDTRLYVGDSVQVRDLKGKSLRKGADLHLLIQEGGLERASHVTVAGVAEVKSYRTEENRMRVQLERHLRRSRQGLCVEGIDYLAGNISVGCGKGRLAVRIAVVPDDWRLPRSFRFEASENGRFLRVDAGVPRKRDDAIERTGENAWRVTLRWSKEALAEAAHEMTFWYMGKVGEVIYSESRPKNWGSMSPQEAGRNAAKMMLYYAILRCRTAREEQRAIALYNSYGYGYALGMNFRNAEGRREMLWSQDLDEILASGRTATGCRLR